MNWSLFEQIKKYLEKQKRQKAWKKIVMSMAIVVVFVTTYLLVLPALTMTQKPVCGKEEHQHTEQCYKEETVTNDDGSTETKKVLICGKEEHKHTDACYKKTTKHSQKKAKTSAVATQSNEAQKEIDFTKYIKNAVFEKLENNTWVSSKEFTDGDEVRIELGYELPPNLIKAGENQTIYYQLPKGISVLKEETGKVEKDGKEVGSYVIGTDGKIKITFNDDFSDGDGFTGKIQFQGKVSKVGSGDKETISIGGAAGNITVKKNTESYDISVKKSGSLKSDNKIEYNITASTTKGTDGKVTIEDAFLSDSANGSYDQNSFKIKKVDAQGKETDVTGYQPTFGKDGNNNETFKITDLPELKAGEKYVVTYEATAKTTKADGAGTVKNGAAVKYGNGDPKWDWSTVEVSKRKIYKEGWYDKDKKLFSWRIVLNEGKEDIGGYTFSDILPGEISGEAVIKDSSGKEIASLTPDANNKISYTFEKGSKDTYTITYQTKASANDTSVSNTGYIGKGDKNYSSGATTGVQQRDWNVNKWYVGTGTEDYERRDAETAKNHYEWKSEITLPDSAMGTFTYTDTIKPATRVDGTSTPGDDSHYAIVSELQSDLEKSLKIWVNVNGESKEEKYDNPYVEFKITYYDKNENEISETDTTSKVQKFKITVIPKDGYKDISGSKLEIQYRTVKDSSGMQPGDRWNFRNEASVGDHTVKADHSYTKDNPMEKQSGIQHSQWWMEYKKGATKISYDETNGVLNYRLLLRTKVTDDGEITVTDTLPEGTTLIKDSVKGFFYADNNSKDCWGDYNFNQNKKPEITVDGQKLTIKVQAGYNSCGKVYNQEEGNVIELRYQVSIKDDEFWKNVTNEEKDYTNHAQWNGNSTEQTTTVNREVEKVQKSAQQLKDAQGKLRNVVEYTVVINPTAKDLLHGQDQLTLTDTMTIPDGVDAYLDLNEVKLYQYDPSKEGNLGDEISTDQYQLSYKQSTHQMTLKLPDELACVLVYRYNIDPGNKNEPNLSNKVTLSGGYEQNIQNAIKTSSSSASVTKAKLTIYKVDSENYKKLLPNAKFSLKYWDGQKWITQSDNFVTNSKGELTLNAVTDKQEEKLQEKVLYKLEETQAPDGYRATDNEYYFIYKGDKVDGKILTDDEVYKVAKAESSQIEKSKINFYGASGGSLYVPNDYTRLSVKKIWVDHDNQITNPLAKSVKMQLYRQKTKLDGCKVTIKLLDKDRIERKSLTAMITKDTNMTIGVDNRWDVTYTIEYNGKTVSGNVINGNMEFTTDEITGDTEIDIISTSDNPYYMGDLKIKKSQESTQYVASGDKQKVGDEVTLSNDNNWTNVWDNLEMMDSETKTPYYYTVEEVGKSSGWSVSYTNNNGIKTGEIIVTNKADGYKLPETGGTGTGTYTKAGILLLFAGSMLLYWKRKYQ